MPQYGGDAERGRGSSRESGERRAAWWLRSVLRRVRCCEVFLPTPAKIKAAQPVCGVFLRPAFVSSKACFRQNMKIYENADLRQQATLTCQGLQRGRGVLRCPQCCSCEPKTVYWSAPFPGGLQDCGGAGSCAGADVSLSAWTSVCKLELLFSFLCCVTLP